MITGEVYAIACAVFWALSSTLTKSQARTIPVVTLGAVRTLPGLVVYWALVLVPGRAGEFARFTPRNWVFLGVSTAFGLINDRLVASAIASRICARSFLVDQPSG